jgi:UDP-glucose 4-epimerase
MRGAKDGNGTYSGSHPVGPNDRVVAVTGACTYLGTELIKLLEADPRYVRVLALDIRRPDLPPDLVKTEHHPIDLTVPTVGTQLAALLRGVDTVVHGAFLSFPTHAASWAHELEDVGTMHVLDACAQVSPARFLLVSTTLVYGPSRDNPNWLTEDAPLRGLSGSRFVSDKLRADLQVQAYAEAHPDTRVAILRFAPILGPGIDNYATRFFSRALAPRLVGHDPLLQFIHEQDAARALKRAVDRDIAGAFNLVGQGVLPYSTVLAMMGRVPMPIPHFVARRLYKALWATQVSTTPPTFLDFLRYLCIADGSRAERELGFRAQFDIQRTIQDFVGLSADDEPDIARAQG